MKTSLWGTQLYSMFSRHHHNFPALLSHQYTFELLFLVADVFLSLFALKCYEVRTLSFKVVLEALIKFTNY